MKPSLTPEEKKLLKIRKERKSRKPVFLRYLWWKFPKFKNQYAWRKPKGNDNKMRLHWKGYPAVVSIGYGAPKEVRGLHPSGFEPVIVYNVKELEKIDPRKQAIYIAHTVGLKKRLEIIRKAQELGIRVLNGGEQ